MAISANFVTEPGLALWSWTSASGQGSLHSMDALVAQSASTISSGVNSDVIRSLAPLSHFLHNVIPLIAIPLGFMIDRHARPFYLIHALLV